MAHTPKENNKLTLRSPKHLSASKKRKNSTQRSPRRTPTPKVLAGVNVMNVNALAKWFDKFEIIEGEIPQSGSATKHRR